MSKLVEEAIQALYKLPENKQETIASLIKEKIVSEKPWNEVIKLSYPTIEKLGGIITGNSNFSISKTQKQIEGFFEDLECNRTKQDSESKRDYTERLIREFDGQLKIERIINWAFRHQYFKYKHFREEAVEYFNKSLRDDGYEMIQNGENYKISKVQQQENNQSKIKQLIFAANGYKPEIVLADAMTNDIKIVKNSEFCLVYDRPIKIHGLLWRELEDWWNSKPESKNTQLRERLRDSLSSESPGETYFWDTYFKKFESQLAEKFPALIPQIYFHYDPYTIKQLGGNQRLNRQRMDFLLLLPNGMKILVEIDGQQHYSEGDKPSPKKYAEMVAEDRKLKFNGYEVYRFGGSELHENNAARENIVENFFENLFEQHKIIQN